MQYNRELIIVPPSDHHSFPTEEFKCPPPGKELYKSISEHGIIEPVVICEWKGGWTVKGGQRRILCGISLTIDIPTIVYHDIDPEDTITWASILNDTARDNPIHTLHVIKELIKDGYNIEDICVTLLLTKQKVHKILKLDRIPVEILGAVQDGKVAVTTAEALASKPEEYYDDALAKFHLQNGKLSGTDVTNLSRDARNNTLIAMFADTELPDAHSNENPKNYAVFDGTTFITFAKDRAEYTGAAMMIGEEAQVFKLIPVEVK